MNTKNKKFPSLILAIALTTLSAGVTSTQANPIPDPSDAITNVLTEKLKETPWEFREIVKSATNARPEHTGDVVKTAIITMEADRQTVAAIMESAILGAPSKAKEASHFAVAVAPDAIKEIRAMLKQLSEKGILSQDSIASAFSENNPLDFPTTDAKGNVTTLAEMIAQLHTGPTAGRALSFMSAFGPGGNTMVFTPSPNVIPEVIDPPVVTNPNP